MQAIQVFQPRNQLLTSEKIFEVKMRSVVQCQNSVYKTPCDLTEAPFDLSSDPREENNSANNTAYSFIFQLMKKNYDETARNVVPSRRRPAERAADPKNFNNIVNVLLNELVWMNCRKISNIEHILLGGRNNDETI